MYFKINISTQVFMEACLNYLEEEGNHVFRGPFSNFQSDFFFTHLSFSNFCKNLKQSPLPFLRAGFIGSKHGQLV